MLNKNSIILNKKKKTIILQYHVVRVDIDVASAKLRINQSDLLLYMIL